MDIWYFLNLIALVIVVPIGIAILLLFFNSEWWTRLFDSDAWREYRQGKAHHKDQSE